MIKICEQCGTEFSVRGYRKDTAKFCSRRCLALKSRVQVDADCAICGKHFTHISSRSNKAKYCSRECYYQSMKGRGSKTFTCAHCGKEFNGSPSHNRKYCSRACVGKASKATWSPAFTTARKSMANRGMLTRCNRCGYSEHPEILGVHHRDRDHSNNSMENLEVLCPNCHSIEHSKHISH